MINNYAVYNPRTGVIKSVVACSAGKAALQAEDGEAVMEVPSHVSDDTHYISEGSVAEKSAIVISMEHSPLSVAITGIPAGLLAYFGGVTVTTDAAPLELDVDEPGRYTLLVRGGAKYLDILEEIDIG